MQHTRAEYRANGMNFDADLHKPAVVVVKGDVQTVTNLARYDYDSAADSIVALSPSSSVPETLKYFGFIFFPVVFFLLGLWMSTVQRRYHLEKVTLTRSGTARTMAARQLALLAAAVVVVVAVIRGRPRRPVDRDRGGFHATAVPRLSAPGSGAGRQHLGRVGRRAARRPVLRWRWDRGRRGGGRVRRTHDRLSHLGPRGPVPRPERSAQLVRRARPRDVQLRQRIPAGGAHPARGAGGTRGRRCRSRWSCWRSDTVASGYGIPWPPDSSTRRADTCPPGAKRTSRISAGGSRW